MGALVTGIGYVGARLAEMLLDSGEAVVGVDNLFSTDPAAIRRLIRRPGFVFLQGDVAEEATVHCAFRCRVPIDTVYHLAAQSSSNPAAAPADYTERTNLVGSRVLLEEACSSGASVFVFGSSLQLYGRRPLGRVDESTPCGPILDLAHLSKPYVEKLMEMHSHTRGLRCVAARLGLVYGVSPVMKTDPRFMTAPNKFCRQAILGEPIRVDSTGLHPTSVIQVDDAARGLMALARWPEEGFTAVNLLGETASMDTVARLVGRLAGQRGLEVRLLLPDEGSQDADCSFHSAASRVGFAPRVPLEEGLSGVLDHFLATDPAPSPSSEATP